jgi:hypothetical protein
MSVQHANRGVVKKDLQLYYNREFSKSFRGEASANLLTYTNTFDSSVWSGYCGPTTNITYNTTDVVDPFGGYTALKVLRNGINTCYGAGAVAMGLLWAGTVFMVAGQTYTMSFYARGALGGETLRFGLNDTHAGGYYITLTTSWVRYSITFTNITDTSRGFQFISDIAITPQIYYLYGPQTENKSYATPYIASTDLKGSRAEATTNFILQTENLTNNWTGNLFNNWINATVTANADLAPNGSLTASRLTGGYARWTNSIAVSASTTYTASIWLKNISLGLDPSINIATGLNGTLVSYGVANTVITRSTIANWRRVSITYTIPASGVNQIQFGIRYEGDYPNQNSILVWGAQFEQKAYATTYLPNSSGSTISRVANTLSGDGGLLDISGNNVNADLTNVSFNSTGYIFTGASSNRVQFTTPTSFIYSAAGKTVLMWVNYGTSSYVGFCGLGNAANGQSFNLRSTAAATAQFLGFMGYNADYDPSAGPQINNNVWHLIGATFDAYGAGNLKLYVDGVNIASTTNTLNTAPEASNIGYIGRSSHTGVEGYLTGQVGQFMMYNRALSADEILQIFNSQRKTYGI